nr:hypothetical protein [Acidimicrobiia bacterium]
GQRAELLGSVAGLAGGAALGQLALWVPLVAGGAGLALLGGWLALRMPESAPVRTHEDRLTVFETVRSTRASMRTRRGMGVALAMMVALGLAGEGVDRMWQLPLVDADAARDAVLVVSALAALGLLGGAAASGFVGRLVATDDPATPRRWLTVANIGVAASVLLLAVGPWWLGAVGFVASMALRTGSFPLVTAWVNRDADPATRATLNSLVGQAESVGEIAGGPILGGIAAASSVGAGLGASAAVFAVAALITAARRAPVATPAPAAP